LKRRVRIHRLHHRRSGQYDHRDGNADDRYECSALTVNDLTTNDTTPTITGTSDEIGGTVTVTIDGTDYTATVDEDGTWSVTITPALEEGEFDVHRSITDAAGNTTTETGTLTIDTQAPTLAVNDLTTNDTTPTITGTSDEIGGTVTVTINGQSYTATVQPNGTWSVDITPALTAGTFTLTASITDAAGNTTTDSGTLTIDTTAPVVSATQGGVQLPITSGSLSVTIDAPQTAVAAFTASETVTWSLNGGTNAALFTISADGTLSFVSASAASLTAYQVVVRATDEVSNTTDITVLVNVREANGPVVTITTDDPNMTRTVDPSTGLQIVNLTLTAPVSQIASFTSEVPVNWTITGGADASLFEISQQGELTYLTPESNRDQLVVITRATDAFDNTTDIQVNLTLSWPVVDSCVNNAQSPGSANMYANCEPIDYVYAQRNENTLAVYSSDETIEMALTALDGNGESLTIIDGRIRLKRDGTILIQGFGMLPGTFVNAWIFSDPVFLGSALVDGDTNFREVMPIGNTLSPGEHTLVLRGITQLGDTLSLSVGVYLDAPVIIVDPAVSNSITPFIEGSTDQPVGSIVKVTINGREYFGEVVEGNRWVVQIDEPLEDGTYEIVAEITDPSGAVSTATASLTVDTSFLSRNATVEITSEVTVGEPVTVIISLLDDQGQPVAGASGRIAVGLTGANAAAEVSEIVDNGDGTYSVTYIPTVVGQDEIRVSVSGAEVPSSPFTVNVQPDWKSPFPTFQMVQRSAQSIVQPFRQMGGKVLSIGSSSTENYPSDSHSILKRVRFQVFRPSQEPTPLPFNSPTLTALL
jgi:large repetitive protein